MTTKLEFSQVPKRAANVNHIGSLIFDKRAELGPFAFIDLTAEKAHPLLARDCIAAMYEHARPGRIGDGRSVLAYGTAIRGLLAYCQEQHFPAAFRLADLTFERLLDYRAHLNVRFARRKSGVRRRRFGCLLGLVQAATQIGLAPSEYSAPRNFSFCRDSDRTQPYAAGELLDLEDACRTHIREILARLERGRQLLAVGSDPRGRPSRNSETGRINPQSPSEKRWNQLPNLLWYVVNVFDGRMQHRNEVLAAHSSFNNSVAGAWGGPYRKKDVYAHLYPLAEDLIPFVVLLAKTTGRNESSILGLRRDCLQEVGERHVLWYEKDRGAARSYRKVIANDGPFSPVQLIRQLREITEPLVRFAAPEDQNRLLLGLTVNNRGSGPVKRLDPAYFKAQMNRKGGWSESRELHTHDGKPLRISMRRLRVNYLTNRYRKTGQLARVSRDAAHTVANTTVPYIVNDATAHIHEEAVERGIRAARALADVTVIPDNNIAAASAALGVDQAAAQRILGGEQDVFFAACRDFLNRPGGTPNTPCDQPWGCLSCSNAVITSHVLPRLVKFRDFVAQQRSVLSDADWHTRFEGVHQVLQGEIMPRFTAETISHAERLAADEVLYMPLTLKG